MVFNSNIKGVENHKKGKYKALKVKCYMCDRVGHFSKICKSKGQGK